MSELSDDPIINVIHNGIKRGIRVTIENKCFGSAIILIYSGIDTMAFLNLSEHETKVLGKNFIEWVDAYMIFPHNACISGIDLYGARCGMVHTYSSFSDISKKGQCKIIGYVDQNIPEIAYKPEYNNSLVVVSLKWLQESFFNAIDKFLIEVFSNPKKAKIAEKRLTELTHYYPIHYNEHDTTTN